LVLPHIALVDQKLALILKLRSSSDIKFSVFGSPSHVLLLKIGATLISSLKRINPPDRGVYGA
jgi:hypothetical protein